jgi:hypothetical protein
MVGVFKAYAAGRKGLEKGIVGLGVEREERREREKKEAEQKRERKEREERGREEREKREEKEREERAEFREIEKSKVKEAQRDIAVRENMSESEQRAAFGEVVLPRLVTPPVTGVGTGRVRTGRVR